MLGNGWYRYKPRTLSFGIDKSYENVAGLGLYVGSRVWPYYTSLVV